MQLIGLAAWGYAAICAFWGIKTGTVSEKTVRLSAFVLLIGSMSVTSTLVWLSGLDVLRTILPLHLCSACTVLCLFFYLKPMRRLFQFLYYIGLPGAALALCFPAVAVSRYQAAMDACFFLTHALIVFAPLLRMVCGERPDPRSALPCWGVLVGFAALVYAANHLLGANYLFLMAAPPGTPLEWLWALGKSGYYAVLAALSLGVVLLQKRFAAHLKK